MNKTTFNRIKMLRKDGMGMKGAITVLIDLCKHSEEAAEKIEELFGGFDDYDRGFVDAIRECNKRVDTDLNSIIPTRKELTNYDPRI